MKCVMKFLGGMVLKISKTSVFSALRIPQKEPYEPWTFEDTEHLYVKRKNNFDNKVAQSWLLKPAEGGSRLPKPLTIEHFIKEIVDIVLLLNRIKEMSMHFTGKHGCISSSKRLLKGISSLIGLT